MGFVAGVFFDPLGEDFGFVDVGALALRRVAARFALFDGRAGDDRHALLFGGRHPRLDHRLRHTAHRDVVGILRERGFQALARVGAREDDRFEAPAERLGRAFHTALEAFAGGQFALQEDDLLSGRRRFRERFGDRVDRRGRIGDRRGGPFAARVARFRRSGAFARFARFGARRFARFRAGRAAATPACAEGQRGQHQREQQQPLLRLHQSPPCGFPDQLCVERIN